MFGTVLGAMDIPVNKTVITCKFFPVSEEKQVAEEHTKRAIQHYAHVLLGMLHRSSKSIKKFMEIIKYNFRVMVT